MRVDRCAKSVPRAPRCGGQILQQTIDGALNTGLHGAQALCYNDGGRDEEMPDDYFNRQQNQRKPRYAAGSDIDSIYTGREVPEGGFKSKEKLGCLPKIMLTIFAIIAIFTVMPSEPLKGEINGQITNFYYSDDRSSATVETRINNETNKTIYNIQLTYTIIDSGGNMLAKNIVDLPNEIAKGEAINHTVVIKTPSLPTGYTEARVEIRGSHRS